MSTATIIFVAACLILAYVMVGYPVLLRIVSKWSAKPVRREAIEPSVTAIIAVYNGEQYLEAKLRSILEANYPPEKLDILVVSDGSTDRTEDIAKEFAVAGVQLLVVPRGGKPAALNAAIPKSSGEILLLTDVRQKLAADSIRMLMARFADPQVGVVSGELLIRGGTSAEEAQIGLYWRFESWIRDRLSSIDSMFGATGPFYAMRRELAVPIPPDTLLDDVYLPLAAFFRGYRLVMESGAVAYDYPTSIDTEFRRKVRTLAGNYQILMAYPKLLGFGNRMWWHFMSYKVGRLALPWALLAATGASLFLPDPWRPYEIGLQTVLYAGAVLDPYLPAKFPLRRITSPTRTFLVMMVAAVRGLAVFFVPARSLWKVTSASRQ